MEKPVVADADSLFSAGDIAGARAVLIDQVRADPGNWQVRSFLFQLFAILGEWDRAESQLKMLAKLDPAAQMLTVAYSQCIAGERQREAVLAGTEVPGVQPGHPWLGKLGDALRLHASDTAAAASLRAQAFDEAPATPGSVDGTAFDWIADADQRFGPTLETIIAGRYGLMPFAALETLDIHAPVDLRDTVWGQAEFGLRDGARVAGFVCVRYPGSQAASAADVVRGRETEWIEGSDGLETGLGHRVMILSDGSEHPLMSLRHIDFEQV